MIEFEEYKVKLNGLKPTLATLKDGMKLDAAREEIRELEARTAADGFWNDAAAATKVQQQMKRKQLQKNSTMNLIVLRQAISYHSLRTFQILQMSSSRALQI